MPMAFPLMFFLKAVIPIPNEESWLSTAAFYLVSQACVCVLIWKQILGEKHTEMSVFL